MSAFNRESPVRAIVALGANLPHEGLHGADLLRAAVRAIMSKGVVITRWSGVWESPAWPPSGQPAFVNAVIELAPAKRTPEEMLALLQEVEAAFGRERRERWGPRTMDLDLIDFGGRIQEGEPTLPHPRAHERPFVLAPLAEMAPDWRHPGLGLSAAELLAGLAPMAGLRRIGAIGQ
jgi:2-amino-4-hydroxy-6-hydroxymethyldihydropteridine diphosphokinase